MQKHIQKIIVILLICILSILRPSVTAKAEQIEQGSQSARSMILIEHQTGEILFEEEAYKQYPPASLTKIMTLLIIMEAIEEKSLHENQMITISEYAASMGGSQVFLEEGEQMSVKDLIKSITIASANDATVALAEEIAGSESAFVKRMNQRAKELGLTNTLFQNTTGLPAENHYSTAYDLAMISKELLTYKEITSYTSIYEDYLRKGERNEFWLVNTNRLVKFFEEVDGLKTGYTNEAKFCLAATAVKNDMRLISVVMGAESSQQRNQVTMNLFNDGFDRYEVKQIYERGTQVGTWNDFQGNKRSIPLLTREHLTLFGKKGTLNNLYETELVLTRQQSLPMNENEVVGTLYVKKEQKTVAAVDVILAEKLDQASLFQLWQRSITQLIQPRILQE